MLRGMRGQRHSERERHPNGEGPSGVGSSHGGEENPGPSGATSGGPRPSSALDRVPPPGAPIRTAWMCGRVALAFVDEGIEGGAGFPVTSLEALEALDVEERPFIWDL